MIRLLMAVLFLAYSHFGWARAFLEAKLADAFLGQMKLFGGNGA